VDAPSNLGLMPPAEGREPGVRNLPGALRSHGLVGRLDSVDAGSVDPPAVDSPQPESLGFEELTELLGAVLGSPQAVGIQVTIFDPELDPDGSLAGRLADLLEDSFALT
jgi:arginase